MKSKVVTAFGLLTLFILSTLIPASAVGYQGLNLVVRGNIESNIIKPPYDDTLNFSGRCLSDIVPNIDVLWDPNPYNCPADRFTAYYYGYIKAPITGIVNFFVQSDDGFYMTIDGQTIIDDWYVQAFGNPNSSGSFKMKKDQIYTFKAWYFENDVGAGSKLYWNLKTNKFLDSQTVIIPTQYFATDPRFWLNENCSYKGNSANASNSVGSDKASGLASLNSNGSGACQNAATR